MVVERAARRGSSRDSRAIARRRTARARLPPLRALAHPMIWLAALPELLVTTAGYAYLFWGPTLMRDALHTSNMQTGLLTGAIAVLCGGRHARRRSELGSNRAIACSTPRRCALVVGARLRGRGAPPNSRRRASRASRRARSP